MIVDFGVVLALLALGVGILALGVGLWHVSEIKKVIDRANDLARSLQNHESALKRIQDTAQRYADTLPQIYESLATRYIGDIKTCQPAIIDLVGRATKNVEILCDFPAYGSYTNCAEFAKYRGAIARKINEDLKPVHLTCFDAERRSEACQRQFAKAQQDWASWIKQNTEHLKNRNGARTDKETKVGGSVVPTVAAGRYG